MGRVPESRSTAPGCRPAAGWSPRARGAEGAERRGAAARNAPRREMIPAAAACRSRCPRPRRANPAHSRPFSHRFPAPPRTATPAIATDATPAAPHDERFRKREVRKPAIFPATVGLVSGLLVGRHHLRTPGKSVVTTGPVPGVRPPRGGGWRPVPRPQNMSNNSMVCAAADGRPPTAPLRGDRARPVGAGAGRAGHGPEPAMNPVLLKPGSDRRSHVVLMGRPGGAVRRGRLGGGPAGTSPRPPHRRVRRTSPRGTTSSVAEGAGQARPRIKPAPRATTSTWAWRGTPGLPAVIVGDNRPRRGCFAALFRQPSALLGGPRIRALGHRPSVVQQVSRGDRGLLAPGPDNDRADDRAAGVTACLPWHAGLWLDSEDRPLDLAGPPAAPAAGARRAGRGRPAAQESATSRTSNALGLEPALDVVFGLRAARIVTDADLIVLPGTRATIAEPGLAPRPRGLGPGDHRARQGAASRCLASAAAAQLLGPRQSPTPTASRGVAGSEGGGTRPCSTWPPPSHAEKDAAAATRRSGYEIHHGPDNRERPAPGRRDGHDGPREPGGTTAPGRAYLGRDARRWPPAGSFPRGTRAGVWTCSATWWRSISRWTGCWKLARSGRAQPGLPALPPGGESQATSAWRTSAAG